MQGYPEITSAIAIAGEKSVGKGTVGKMLERLGYAEHRYSTAIRAIAVERSKAAGGDGSYTTKILQDIGDEFRASHGYDHWSRVLLKGAQESGDNNIYIDGVRNPGDIRALQELLGDRVTFVALTAPVDLRCDWALARKQAGDPLTREGFLEMDERDHGVGQPDHGQHVGRCIDIIRSLDPSMVYDNVGTLADLETWAGCHVVPSAQRRALAARSELSEA